LPLSSQATATTSRPHICAVAGLVPWADFGIRQTLRAPWPLRRLVAADGDEAGVLALRAGIRLHADRIEAGDRLELVAPAR
jgi:hypothetical protein